MASLKTTITGNLGAQREAEGAKFFDKKVKKAGDGGGGSPFSPMSKPRLAQTDAQIGSLPSGGNTVGGVVGGLSDKGNYQGMKAGCS
jgi:hypothetical protein